MEGRPGDRAERGRRGEKQENRKLRDYDTGREDGSVAGHVCWR
jgi:hypothetical protein